MTFIELDELITKSGRRSIASSLIAYLLDALDTGSDGLDLDVFQQQTGIVRTNITSVANYLKLQGLIIVLYYREESPAREYAQDNHYGRWAKQHYQLCASVKALYRRN
ncbi:hypothetical protein D3C76_418470 [compost metagenome]